MSPVESTSARHAQPRRPGLVVPVVLRQHVEDAAILHATRTVLTAAPHVRLRHLRRFDERLEAHLDGLAVAGEHAWPLCEAALERPSSGATFAAAIRAIADNHTARLGRLIALAGSVPSAHRGLLAAFGWLETDVFSNLLPGLLGSSTPLHRLIGMAACAMHRLDPDIGALRRFADEDALVRARVWRTAGEMGKRELVSTAAALVDQDPACQFWAAWAAVLLGDKHNALDVVASIAAVPGPFRARAFQLTLQAKGAQSAHGWLATLAKEPANLRWLIRGAGLVGDPTYVPWLIGHMADTKTTRLAGEAFSLITGLDLAWLDLEVKPPENFESGPNDDPNDPNVDMDEDDGLPWPDAAKIQAWWHSNSGRFQPGTRYFMGEPLNRDNCVRVLKEGFQRQRIAAALYLSLLNPGTPLFEWRAPAPRQRRQLAEMT
ncbi:MAG: TIGR02270 family protein [Steroidobacteraceae bacterium]